MNLFSQNIEQPVHGTKSGWIPLQNNDSGIWIGYTETTNIDWCRTISLLPYNIDRISKMIEDKGNYYKIFDRVTSSTIVRDDVVHIRIDMPFPISDRDYVVRYTIEDRFNEISYKFESAKDIYIPKFSSSIRLPNAAGEWYLRRIDDTSTEVVYTWNGELGGDFPSFALTRAWTTQGNEMIVWLKESLDELYTNRE